MTTFTWTRTGTGDWATASNWNPTSGPPGAGDDTNFDSLASDYTVTVTTTVDVTSMTINPLSPGLSVPSFSINGSLTTGSLDYMTAAGGPATSMAITEGGTLDILTALDTAAVAQTISIAGTGAGGRMVLGDPSIGAAGSNITFDFVNGPLHNAGVIEFDNTVFSPPPTTQTIKDVIWGDEFVIIGQDFTGGLVNYNDSTNVLTVTKNGSTVFTMDNIFLQSGATGGFSASGNVIVATCYVRGTMIQTPTGDLAVETLRPGMQVITLVDGENVPRTVKWVGHRRIDLTRHPRPETVAPIRIVRDAFADNVPHTDLLLSPDHAVFVDGLLICIRQLANGSTIRMERSWTAVDYYHVELNEHAILLAEGLPVESYLDTGNRGFFANSGAPLVLHPDLPNENRYPTRETNSCAPFVSDAASVQPIWQRFVDRAAAIGRPGSQRVTTTDARLHLQCPGRQTIEPTYCDSQRAIFILPDAAPEVRLVSRAQVPTEARPWLDDQRQLGVRVKRLVLRGADETNEVAMDHPDLTRGWWAVEHDGPIMSRWTDGEAVLSLPTMRGTVVLEVHLAGAMTYVLDAGFEGVTERRIA